MTDPATHPLEAILRHCAAARPNPWYPSAHAQATGVARDSLDPHLDRLRLGGLVHLTDWVPDHGQGYALTPAGEELLNDPRRLALFVQGRLTPPGGDRPPATPGSDPASMAWERREAVRAALGDASTPVVTLVIIGVNLIVFLGGLALASRSGLRDEYLNGASAAPGVREVYHLSGDLSGPAVYVHHQWWRLLTACFVHIGWVHLASNMVSLVLVGPLLERLWGHGRFLLLYLLAGLGGSCGMLIDNPVGGGAGASGALWGILASLIPWMMLHRRDLAPGVLSHWATQLILVFGLNFYLTFKISVISKGGHFGGGLVGLLVSVPLDSLRFAHGTRRALAAAALAAIPVVCIGVLVYSFRTSGPAILTADLTAEFQREAVDFDTHYLPDFRRAMTEAQHAYSREETQDLLDQRADARDPKQVQEAVRTLADKRAGLVRVIDQLKQVPPYADRRVERARQATLHYLAAQAQLLEVAEDFLAHRKGQTPDDRRTLMRQEEELARAGREWKKVFDEPG